MPSDRPPAAEGPAPPDVAPTATGGERLSAYHDGELSAADRAAVERELSDDPADRAVLAEYRRLSALLHALPADPVPAPIAGVLRDRLAEERGRSAARRAARRIAAAILAASVVAAVFFLPDDPVGTAWLALNEPTAVDRERLAEVELRRQSSPAGPPAGLAGRSERVEQELAFVPEPAAPDAVVAESLGDAVPPPGATSSDSARTERGAAGAAPPAAPGFPFGPDAAESKAWAVGDLIPLAAPDGGVAVVYFQVLDARRARDEVELLLSRHRVAPRPAGPAGEASDGELAVLVVSPGANVAAALEELVRSDLVVAVEPRTPIPADAVAVADRPAEADGELFTAAPAYQARANVRSELLARLGRGAGTVGGGFGGGGTGGGPLGGGGFGSGTPDQSPQPRARRFAIAADPAAVRVLLVFGEAAT